MKALNSFNMSHSFCFYSALFGRINLQLRTARRMASHFSSVNLPRIMRLDARHIRIRGQSMMLSDFPITKRWVPKTSSAIQLYSLPTPNGVKVSIALEEMGLPYEPHLIDFGSNDQTSPEFLSLNPNNKIPAIIDPVGPGGKPLALFESGAILIYLAEKSGKLLPELNRYEVLQWLIFQMGGVGPMFGQLGYFAKFAGKEIEDPRPKERYRSEVARLLLVLDKALAGRDWIAGEFSIADIAICPWLQCLRDFYMVGEITGWADLVNIPAYLERFLARPAVQKGMKIPARG
jgi:GST-like protein